MIISQRLRTQDLRNWKQQTRRKPLLLEGARQVGKTYLITQLFGPEEFNKVHHLDFRVHPELAELFQETIDPRYSIVKHRALFGNQNQFGPRPYILRTKLVNVKVLLIRRNIFPLKCRMRIFAPPVPTLGC